MGQLDGKPTPRDSVLEPEIIAEYEALYATGASQFEIYYTDWSIVAGSSQKEWNDAPNDEVQFLIWESSVDGSIHLIVFMDIYVMGGSVKYGNWMDDRIFWKMLEEQPLTSDIIYNNKKLS